MSDGPDATGRPAAQAGVSPLVAGIALAAASAAAGVVSALFIPNPAWGVPAAIVLAFAGVGVGAGLLLTRRRSWSDRTWPPGGEPTGWSAKRSRRLSLGYGVFFLVLSAVGIVGLLQPGSGDVEDSARGWFLFALTATAGTAMTITGLRRIAAPVESSDRPMGDPTEDDPGWIRIGPERQPGLFPRWAPFAFSNQPFLVPVLVLAIAPVLFRLGVWAWALTIAAIVAGVVITALVLRRRATPPSASRDGSLVRAGTVAFPASEIVSAMVIASPWEPDATERSLAVVLATADGKRVSVGLRDRGRLALTQTQTDVLGELVSRSSIELPRDKDDPRGRFSRALYPNFLTKADALDLIRRPPGDGERLPFGPPTA